jgi:hypothetical protein
MLPGRVPGSDSEEPAVRRRPGGNVAPPSLDIDSDNDNDARTMVSTARATARTARIREQFDIR